MSEPAVPDALRAFDPEGARLVDRLVASGNAERARARLETMATARAAAEAELDDARRRLRESGAREPREIACAIQEGDLRHARRLVERALVTHARLRDAPAAKWAQSLAERARSRSIRLAPDLAARVRRLDSAPPDRSLDEARAVAAELSRAMHDEALTGARATVALARVRDSIPEGAGPYNPQAIAADALARLGALSPSYAAAFIASLDDITALDLLAPPPKARAPRRRR